MDDPWLTSHERLLWGYPALSTLWEMPAEPYHVLSTGQERAGAGPTKLVMSKPRGKAWLRQQCMENIPLAEVFLPPACSS